MRNYDIIVIGAGASGMMAAIAAAREGASVLILEKMERAGRKIRITGKGRCNLTNTKEWGEFASHIHPNSNFFKSSFFHFGNRKTISFFESLGMPVVVERGERAFPESMNAASVTEAMLGELDRLKVEIKYNSRVTDIVADGGVIKYVSLSQQQYEAKAVIVATGGRSYPLTGSDGDGYIFAERLGHEISNCFPSLTAIMPSVYNKSLSGLELKNVELTLLSGKDLLQQEFGDLVFTDNGIEGPIGLRISRKCVKALIDNHKVSVVIDLKPALDHGKLLKRIEREISAKPGIKLGQLMLTLIPAHLVSPFLEYHNMNRKKDMSIIDKHNIDRLAAVLKCWKLDVSNYTGYERAVVTAGGVALGEIVPKSLKSKRYENLFFAGEVLDLDGDTGGYNLQIAFSTGHLAGTSASHLIQKEQSIS